MEKDLNETQMILQYALFRSIPNERYSSSDNFSTLHQIAEGAFSACQQFLADGSPLLMGSNEESNQKTSLFHSFEFTTRWKKLLMEDAIVFSNFLRLLSSTRIERLFIPATAFLGETRLLQKT